VCRAADVSDEDAWPRDTTDSAMAAHAYTTLGRAERPDARLFQDWMNEAQGLLGERGLGQLAWLCIDRVLQSTCHINTESDRRQHFTCNSH